MKSEWHLSLFHCLLYGVNLSFNSDAQSIKAALGCTQCSAGLCAGKIVQGCLVHCLWTSSRAVFAVVSISTCCCRWSRVRASLLPAKSISFFCRRGMSGLWLLCIELSQRTAMSAMASCTWTSLTAADYDTESASKRENRHKEERDKEKERPNKQAKPTPSPFQGYPTGVCEKRGPSRGTPWWPLQPLVRLLEFIVIHITGAVLASFATSASGILVYCIALCGAFVPIRDALFWSSRTRFILCRNCSGWSTNACASWSGRSRTIAISIASPSCWKRGGRPSWSLSKIATALFSHIVRSHSSSARPVRAAFCGGAGLPRLCAKRLSGGLAWWRFCSSRTVWSSSSSKTSLERSTFGLM